MVMLHVSKAKLYPQISECPFPTLFLPQNLRNSESLQSCSSSTVFTKPKKINLKLTSLSVLLVYSQSWCLLSVIMNLSDISKSDLYYVETLAFFNALSKIWQFVKTLN
ncbi:hypothetical protein ILYODFUR_014629 [Ilyodon furcidens]|uniref:Uncharacterized protein n=1 Tax=Ilyodon furcidens TaxID=33524 RepID=A0ABV0TUN8_9TELE